MLKRMSTSHKLRIALLSASAIAFFPAAAAAAELQADPPETTTPEPEADAPGLDATDTSNEGENIVVTGTSRARAAFNTPLAVSTLDDDRLARIASSSQADILNTIPTIKADAGGGEVASNVFIRGLPSGGQYQFTPLMFDGMPVLSTFGLNSSAYDVYYRPDLGVDRLEFVRGGVSNLFGPGSVAGLINYISRTGNDEFHGVAQLEVGEVDRYRGDVAISGPLSSNIFFALSAYYRMDEGPIRTDLDTEGFQVRGNLRFRFADGSGNVTLYGQYIDDQVQFYLPIPLNGTTRNRAPGNDGRDVFSVQFNNFGGLGFNTPDGPFSTRIDDGVLTRGGSLGLTFDKDFGEGWGINGRARYADYTHRFGLWSDGDGLINVPETLQSFLTNRGLGSLANASFTFADDGSAVPANFLLFANRFTDRERPMHDMTAELNLTKELLTGSLQHTLTFGGFIGNASARDINVTTTYLAEFNNRPRLVELVVTNPVTGAQTIVSRDGLLNAGAGYTNNRHEATRYAFYAADQMEGDRFALDIGFRWEHFSGDIRRERTSTFVTDATTPNLSNALRDVVWGNGNFLTAEVDTSEWAAAIGGLYRITPNLNIYANASRGYFFPEIRAVAFSGAGVPQADYNAEIIKQAELGLKFNNGRVSASIAGLYTRLNNRRQVLFVNDGLGGFTERVNLVGTESYGAEATLTVRLIDNLTFDGNITYMHHEYVSFIPDPATVPPPPSFQGNELERQPNLLYNAGLYYDDDTIDAAIFTNYTGDNFVASNNLIELEGFNIVNLDAGYTLHFGDEQRLRIGVNVFNLFDTDATTEGSPRQDNNQTTGGAFFVGRPVLPRRVVARLTFNF
jgi:iron complex outermembrane recepter protein